MIAIICEVRKRGPRLQPGDTYAWMLGVVMRGVSPLHCVNQHILHFENQNKWLENHSFFSSPTSLSIDSFDIYTI